MLRLSYDALKSASSKMHYGAANALKTVEEEPGVYLDNLRSWRVMEILCQGDELSMAYSATERTTICDTILEFVFGVPEIPEIKEEEPETFTFAVRGASTFQIHTFPIVLDEVLKKLTAFINIGLFERATLVMIR